MCLRKLKKTVDASCYSSTPTLSMPTVKEINKIEKDLETTDIKFCGSCLKEDNKTTIDVVKWIQYDGWLHLCCTQPQLTTIYQLMSFL